MFSARWHTSHRTLWVFYFFTIIYMVSELPGWLAYQDQLGKAPARASSSERVERDYPKGIGSEGCGWDAYPELLHVEQDARDAVEDALSA